MVAAARINLFWQSPDYDYYTAGQTIFFEGQHGDEMYVVQSGEVDIYAGGHLVEVAGPGDVIGEMALVDRMPRSATAIARTDCKIVPVDRERFEFLVQNNPSFAIRVMQVMSSRLRTMDHSG